ncbi:MAG: glycoside hydrolase family 2 TIM barrel-domain containing protein [Rikenellaceae bacterium]
MKKFLSLWLLISLMGVAIAQENSPIRYSTAGFYALPGSPRTVESLNPAWRFTLDPTNSLMDQAWRVDFDDSQWGVVSLPNGLEELPVEASGGVNYRNGAWYRKHFTLDQSYSGKRLVLYFEAIMGKSKIWVNGELVKEQFGGYLPIAVEVDKYLKAGRENVIAVWCDNSNDPIYPPGKPQEALDFCYFGGIYRDTWLIATNKKCYITDENMADRVAGGGTFISTAEIANHRAVVAVTTDIVGKGQINYQLKDQQGMVVAQSRNNATAALVVENPQLWTPQTPYLYELEVSVIDSRGNLLDSYMKKVGVRTIEFSHTQGFVLNGEAYPRKLMGANRHQDFAIVGNALSNNLHWRDAQKLKEAGMEIIRNAHYPQDPAFMDACDELGLFVIVNTPGWQFWNDEPIFKERVYSDIRNMVRRDRNRASVLMWEPILNETWYPDDFALTVHDIVKEELPGAYTACDLEAKGSQYFDVLFTHPAVGQKGDDGYVHVDVDTTKVYYTREWGDFVDDWNSHNSPDRVARNWGEVPQLVQAKHQGNPAYTHTSYESLSKSPVYHFGGTLWHSFDHQRGYHPDPFYGGIMTSFRRPKYSYFMHQAQADYVEPMVYIANELTPFSPEDVTVFTNCESVRLRTFVGDTLRVKKREGRWITFEGAYDFVRDQRRSRSGLQSENYLLAQGLNSKGEVIAEDYRATSRRTVRLEVVVDTMSATPIANGSDLVVVVAQIVDGNGNVKRLNNGIVKFEVEGEGRILGNSLYQTNPTSIEWGEAPVLIQTTLTAGEIRVRASMLMTATNSSQELLHGVNTPVSGEVVFCSVEDPYSMIYDKGEASLISTNASVLSSESSESMEHRQRVEDQLREVERQQSDFGEKRE